MAYSSNIILSIGHSTQSYDQLLTKLRSFDVTAVADVRSSPVSRRYPQFNWDELKASLAESGIAYSFLGKELGGRPKDPALFTKGTADYEKMALTPTFAHGVSRLLTGAENYRIALLCSEYHASDCHRCLLVGRSLRSFGIDVMHITEPGRSLRQTEVEEQLLEAYKLPAADMFISNEEQLARAYRYRAQSAAYSDANMVEKALQNG